MAGLLDFLGTPDAQLGMGLLAAAGPRSDGAGFGQRLTEGMGYAQAQQDAALKRKMTAMQMQEQEQKFAKDKAVRDMLARFTTQAQPGMAPLQGDAQSGILPSAGHEAKPAGFDYQGYAGALAGIDPMQALQLQAALKKEGPKFSTAPQYDQQGNAFILAENGEMKYLSGVKARDKLNEVRLGDKVVFRTDYSPELQGSMAIGQSPDSQASNAVTMRGQNMTDSRARDLNAITQQGNAIKLGEKADEKALAKAGQVASFDVMLGSLGRLSQHPGLARSVGVVGAFPTMPGSESANFKAELETFQSQAFLPMVSQLKGMGALSDAEGKKLTAAVGALNPAMGEKAFRESVSRINGDMTAARARLTGENKGGASGVWGAPAKASGGWSIQRAD